jgi:hypothetical protein
MYEYIKGKKVELEEHMLSASEIATIYNIFTVEGKQPHGLMISALLRQFIDKTNLNVAEYYYPHSRGAMRVYPEMVWKPAMNKFIYDNNLDIDFSNDKRIFKLDSERKKFMYIHSKTVKQSKRIIDINERRQQNGN